MNDWHAPNDVTRYTIGPGPVRCGIHGTVIVERRCADCDANRHPSNEAVPG